MLIDAQRDELRRRIEAETREYVRSRQEVHEQRIAFDRETAEMDRAGREYDLASPRCVAVTNYTRRRRWGYGWTNTPERFEGIARIPYPTEPDVTGTYRQCQEAHQKAARINNDNWWTHRFFWEGRPVQSFIETDGSTLWVLLAEE